MRWMSLPLFLALLLASRGSADEFKLEPGFKLLFNGKNLDGWKQKTGGDALEGKTEAYKGRFAINDGTIVIDPSVKGDVRIMTTKEFSGDVHIKFEFKPDEKCNNDLFLRGHKFDILGKSKNVKVGEWNEFEIILTGDKAEFKCNGKVERTATTKAEKSPFEIRAEFGAITIRNLRVKEG